MANRTKVRAEWIDAEIFEREDPAPHLEGFHAILVPGGFGERGTEGKISAAQYARERKIPYLGICLGMQMAVIESARNLAGIADAGSEEFDHEAGAKRFTPVVYHLKEWIQGNHVVARKVGDDKGGTMRLGAYTATLKPGSKVAEIYGSTTIEERHRHRYEVDAKYMRRAGKMRPDLFRHEPRRPPARDRRGQRPPVVYRRAVPPGAEIETLCAASAVCGFCAGGEGSGAVGLNKPTLIEAHIPAEFLRLLGAYLQTCAYVEWEVAVIVTLIEGRYYPDLSDKKHRFPAICKLQTSKLIERLKRVAEKLPGDLKFQLLEIASDLENGKATRHTAVHGAFYFAEGQTSLSVDFYHQHNETDFTKEEAKLDFESTRQVLLVADEILKRLIEIRTLIDKF